MVVKIPQTGPSRSLVKAPCYVRRALMPRPTSYTALRHLRRNSTVLFIHGLLGQTGFRLLQAPTFLPTYINLLTGSSFAVGLARAAQSCGMFLSPLFGTGMVERRQRLLRLTFTFGSVMRLQILVLALIALFAPKVLALWLVWPALLAWGLASGLQALTFNVLLAKTIPTQSRGRIMGARNLGSSLVLLVVAAVAGTLLDRMGFPRGYGAAFLLAFALTTVGLLSMLWLREPPAREVRSGVSWRERLREIPRLLSSDRAFSGFLRARLLATAARGALPFYILTLGQKVELTGTQIAGFTIAFTLAQGVAGLTWGVLADRRGFRNVFILALLSWIAGGVAVAGWNRVEVGYLVFIAIGAGLAGLMLAGQNMVLEFGTEMERPMLIATSNTLSEAVGMLGFMGAGVLAELTSPQIAVLSATALQVLAVSLLMGIDDPRRVSKDI